MFLRSFFVLASSLFMIACSNAQVIDTTTGTVLAEVGDTLPFARNTTRVTYFCSDGEPIAVKRVDGSVRVFFPNPGTISFENVRRDAITDSWPDDARVGVRVGTTNYEATIDEVELFKGNPAPEDPGVTGVKCRAQDNCDSLGESDGTPIRIDWLTTHGSSFCAI